MAVIEMLIVGVNDDRNDRNDDDDGPFHNQLQERPAWLIVAVNDGHNDWG